MLDGLYDEFGAQPFAILLPSAAVARRGDAPLFERGRSILLAALQGFLRSEDYAEMLREGGRVLVQPRGGAVSGEASGAASGVVSGAVSGAVSGEAAGSAAGREAAEDGGERASEASGQADTEGLAEDEALSPPPAGPGGGDGEQFQLGEQSEQPKRSGPSESADTWDGWD